MPVSPHKSRYSPGTNLIISVTLIIAIFFAICIFVFMKKSY